MRKMSVLAIVIAAFITATYAEKGKSFLMCNESNGTCVAGVTRCDLSDRFFCI